jgi:hypothetical protein
MDWTRTETRGRFTRRFTITSGPYVVRYNAGCWEAYRGSHPLGGFTTVNEAKRASETDAATH